MLNMLVQVAPGVWIYPRDEDPNKIQPNVGIIVAGGQTVLVDGGNSPRHARRILMALDEIPAPPVSYVIYTHSHWDHVFGGMIFGAPVIAHELCRKQLSETATKPWSQSYIQEEIQRTPAREAGLRALGRSIEDWRGFRLLLPEIVLSKLLSLHLAGTTIEIEHVGGHHSPDSVVVRLPEARVLFVSDCYYPPPAHLRKPGDALDTAMIEALAAENQAVYIDGHGAPMSHETFQQIAAGGRGD